MSKLPSRDEKARKDVEGQRYIYLGLERREGKARLQKGNSMMR